MTLHDFMGWRSAARFAPPDDWAMVGTPGDRDRRPHYARIKPLLAPTDASGRVRPYLAHTWVVPNLEDGRYLAARSINPARLRPPGDFRRDDAPDDPLLADLSFAEAVTLARLVGGRMASEKEADFLLSSAWAAGRLDPNASSVRFWTSSSYDPFAYSLTWFDPGRRAWVATDRRATVNSNRVTTIWLDPAAGRLRRQPADPGTEHHAALVVRDA